jgi:hypothetical protein
MAATTPEQSRSNRKYRSRSICYRALITSPDPNTNKLYHVMNAHPAREYIHIGPLWQQIYQEHRKSSLTLQIARKTATVAVLDVMNKIAETLDPFRFKPITLEIYK